MHSSGFLRLPSECTLRDFLVISVTFCRKWKQNAKTTMYKHPPVAKYILVLTVRGIFVKINFSYAHFATCGITGDVLFPIIWVVICQLEIIGLKVICITGDGASPNRKFIRMHNTGLVYKTPNQFSKEKRFVYFISNPPHLVKTVCNCWSHSGYNGTRWMTVSCTTVCVITMNVILL